MPTYTYKCPIHNEFEEFHSISIKLEHCPKCKEESNVETPIERLISLTGKGVVELYGDELVAKVKEDAKKLKKEVYSNEKTYANMISEDRYQKLQTAYDKNKR